jgi:hypothetical protein
MGKIINKRKILSIDKVNGNIVIDTVYIEGIVTGASTNNLNYSNDGIYTLTMTLMPLSKVSNNNNKESPLWVFLFYPIYL